MATTNMTFNTNLLPSSNLGCDLGGSNRYWNIYGTLTGNATGATGYVAFPQNNTYQTTSTTSITGALKITLPQYNTNTVISFDVNVYTYNGANASTVTYHISGYVNGANGWNTTGYRVYSEGLGNYTNLPVRFGYDGSKSCVIIGNITDENAGTTATVWSVPQVSISNILCGYKNYSVDKWRDGWSISFITILPTVAVTSTNINIQDINITGNASTATKVQVTNTTPSSATSYYLTYTNSTTTGNQSLRNNSRLYYHDTGTLGYLVIGNTTNSGAVIIRNENGKYATIASSAFSANRTLTLPDQTGTFALTSDIPPADLAVSAGTATTTYITLGGTTVKSGTNKWFYGTIKVKPHSKTYHSIIPFGFYWNGSTTKIVGASYFDPVDSLTNITVLVSNADDSGKCTIYLQVDYKSNYNFLYTLFYCNSNITNMATAASTTAPTNIDSTKTVIATKNQDIAGHAALDLALTGGTMTGVLNITNNTASSSTSTGALTVTGGIGCGDKIYASQVWGAVWNDYAECRNVPEAQIIKPILKPGMCVHEVGDGTMAISTERLERGCKIISDTYGFNIGKTDNCKTPIAVSGRVLAYVHEDKNQIASHIGWPVCSGPNGTVSIMTAEEEEKYPSRIIGTISEIPNYDVWGTDKVIVDERIWIYVK